jgi:hypothetical protein
MIVKIVVKDGETADVLVLSRMLGETEKDVLVCFVVYSLSCWDRADRDVSTLLLFYEPILSFVEDCRRNNCFSDPPKRGM